MRRYALSSGWEYTDDFSADFISGDSNGKEVTIPHACGRAQVSIINGKPVFSSCGYRRELYIPEEWEDERVFATFDGAVGCCAVYINGCRVAAKCGSSFFSVELTSCVRCGGYNILCLEMDRDSALDCGIFRDVWLEAGGCEYAEALFEVLPVCATEQRSRRELCLC